MIDLPVSFAAGECAPHTFLGLVPWYQYINLNSACGFDANHPLALLGAHSVLLLILLAVVDDLMRIAGLVAVMFVIFAGFQYITSQGSPDQTARAQSTIINALVGLAIAVFSIGTVSFIGSQLTSSSGGTTTIGLNLDSLPNTNGVASGDVVKTILSIVFGVLGALSLLFVIIGGFRYILSQGDSQNVSRAKNTILYALVGLAVAVVAESIVGLVLGKFL